MPDTEGVECGKEEGSLFVPRELTLPGREDRCHLREERCARGREAGRAAFDGQYVSFPSL